MPLAAIEAFASLHPIRHNDTHFSGGRAAAYFFIYPNAMVNRYGPWLDVSVVEPAASAPSIGASDHMPHCRVTSDWWLDSRSAGDAAFVEASLTASEQARPARRKEKVGELTLSSSFVNPRTS